MSGRYSDIVDEIVDKDLVNGRSYEDMASLAERYGFRCNATTGRSVSKHMVYVHREYHNLRFILAKGSGEVAPKNVKTIGKLCRQVRERNAEAREIMYDRVPAWVLNAMPEACCAEQKNNSVIVEAIDLNAKSTPLARRYEVKLKGKSLSIESLDYAGGDYRKKFTIVEGMRNREEALRRVISELDARVRANHHLHTQKVDELLGRLKANRCFELTEEPFGHKGMLIHLHNPLHHLDYAAELPSKRSITPAGLVHQLEAIMMESDEYIYAQMTLVHEELKAQGWSNMHVKSQGGMGELTLTHANGASFTMPTYGRHEIFDMEAMRAMAASYVKPEQRVNEAQHKGASKPEKLPMADQVDVRMREQKVRRA